MEIPNRKNHIAMIPCPRSYGIAVGHTYSKRMHDARDVYTDPFTNRTMTNQIDWLVMKGDLLLAKESREIEKNLSWNFDEKARRVCCIPLVEYLDDDLPERYTTAQEGSFSSSQSCTMEILSYMSQISIPWARSLPTCRISRLKNSKSVRIR
jgi:hypothetical protein